MMKPELDEYLDKLHTEAAHVSSMVEGALILETEGTKEAENAALNILAVAAPMAADVIRKLDSVNRPTVQPQVAMSF